MINFSILEFQDGGRQTAGAPPPSPLPTQRSKWRSAPNMELQYDGQGGLNFRTWRNLSSDTHVPLPGERVPGNIGRVNSRHVAHFKTMNNIPISESTWLPALDRFHESDQNSFEFYYYFIINNVIYFIFLYFFYY